MDRPGGLNDNKTGMEKQMTSLANLGMLANFVGMLTDSRSFLSYPRHEVFSKNFSVICLEPGLRMGISG